MLWPVVPTLPSRWPMPTHLALAHGETALHHVAVQAADASAADVVVNDDVYAEAAAVDSGGESHDSAGDGPDGRARSGVHVETLVEAGASAAGRHPGAIAARDGNHAGERPQHRGSPGGGSAPPGAAAGADGGRYRGRLGLGRRGLGRVSIPHNGGGRHGADVQALARGGEAANPDATAPDVSAATAWAGSEMLTVRSPARTIAAAATAPWRSDTVARLLIGAQRRGGTNRGHRCSHVCHLS